ncbi:MAG: DUF4143 domain-containing protein [Propionibacteriaceae bacterium]|jgi:predicted AAA+ superfamily ATPase|nr:DUF4143 domain-containing protein [Propionibacteriaceae bacterium]
MELFEDLPAVSVIGPRACGKTTTARQIVPNVVHLDQEAVAQAFREDPDAALKAVGEPVLLDEWQFAPEVLGAVKRAVDLGGGAGRFMLTGSVSAQLSPQQWAGTGRVTELRMSPMTATESQDTGHKGHRLMVDRLATADADDLTTVDRSSLDISDYVGVALRSGFPQVVNVRERSREAWLRSYRDQVVSRDAQLAHRGIDSARFGQYLHAMALHSGAQVSAETLNRVADVSKETGAAYEQLLQRLYLLTLIPAWSSRRLQRLVKSPRRVLADAALMAAILGEDARGIVLDSELRGRVMETFVATQLLAELPFAQSRVTISHLRDGGGRHEVDFIVEYPRGRVVGVEVKASSTVSPHDARHLVWLRDRMGEQFIRGVVFYAGPFVRQLDDRVFALPMSALWEG